MQLAQSFGATGVTKIGTGVYQVDFNRNITNCAYNATQGDPGVGGARQEDVVVVTKTGCKILSRFSKQLEI
jgi:Xaa-Pro aminopeptidase